MLQTSSSFDALGGEHCGDGFLAQEVEGTSAKDAAEIVQGEVALLVQLRSQLSELLHAALRLVKGEDAFLVDILSTSPEVDEPHHAIEGPSAFLKRRQSELANDLFHYPLRPQSVGEVRVELVDDVGLAILSGAFPLFPMAFLPALLRLLPLLLGDFGECGDNRGDLRWNWE